MNTYSTLFKITFCACLLLGTSGCFRSIGENLTKGVTSQLDSTYLENTSAALARGALQELLKEETQQQIRQQLDSLLQMTGDTLDQLSQRLTANFLGEYTEEWIDARTNQLIGKIDSSLQLIKGQLLNEDLENYLQHLSRDILSVELKRLSTDLLDDLMGAPMTNRLAAIRPAISQELDSIIQAAILSVALNSSQRLLPLLDSLSLTTGGVIQQAEDTSKGLIRYLLIGLVVVILVGIIIWQLVWNNRYQSMLEVVTKNINQVPSQKIYDQLTDSIHKDMESRGLESHLRQQVLSKIELLDQPEWKDKDAQVLQLIKNTLKEEMPAEEEEMTRSVGPRGRESDFAARLKEKAREVGLEDHLDSMLDR